MARSFLDYSHLHLTWTSYSRKNSCSAAFRQDAGSRKALRRGRSSNGFYRPAGIVSSFASLLCSAPRLAHASQLHLSKCIVGGSVYRACQSLIYGQTSPTLSCRLCWRTFMNCHSSAARLFASGSKSFQHWSLLSFSCQTYSLFDYHWCEIGTAGRFFLHRSGDWIRSLQPLFWVRWNMLYSWSCQSLSF